MSVVAEANKLATSVPTWKNIKFALSTIVITKLSNYVQLVQEQSSRQLSRLEQGLKSRRASVERRECKSGAFKSLCLPQWFTRYLVFLPNWDAPKMTRVAHLEPYLSAAQLKHNYREATHPIEARHWQLRQVNCAFLNY